MITLEEIQQARAAIQHAIIRTPLVYSPNLSQMFECHVYFKLENLQKTGSFKLRGAMNKILKERDTIGAAGVVAASAGNHAQGVAFSASLAGFCSTLIMPEWASITKQEATRSYGGKVVLYGDTLGGCIEKSLEMVTDGKTFIHPFNDPAIIAGQGTIGLEIMEDLPGADVIVVPIGGGGLIAGIAKAAKAIRPKVHLIGVQAQVCPSAWEARRQGSIVTVSGGLSIADGICVQQTGELPFHIIQQLVDEIVLVEEEHIAAAILLLIERRKILAEGAGAVTLSALLGNKIKPQPDQKVVLVISGGNLDSPLLGRIINRGLIKTGRLVKIKIKLLDIPGALSTLLTLLARLKANILHIYHNRNIKNIPVNVSYVELELETRNFKHINEIHLEIEQAGYEIDIE